MKDKLNRPCAECPWKRTSLAGWLGASSAQDFVLRADRQAPMECHMTVEYNDVNWKASLETDEVAYCRGAAEYMANTFSSPRNPAWRAVVDRAVEEAGDRTNSPAYPGIFGWTDEFLAHHDNDMNARYVEESHSLATNKPYPNAFDTQEEYETALAKWREEHAS